MTTLLSKENSDKIEVCMGETTLSPKLNFSGNQKETFQTSEPVKIS
jgi:hypothetical protein